MMGSKRWLLAVGVILVLGIVAAFHYYKRTHQSAAPAQVAAPVTYESATDGITFTYPPTYKLETHELDIENMKGKYLTLTPADVQVPEAGEGPPGITIEIFDNAKQTPLATWLQNNTHGTPAPSSGWDYGEAVVAGEKGIAYSASGLYESDNIAVAHNGKIYVFSASWATRDDQTLKDLQSILVSVHFSK